MILFSIYVWIGLCTFVAGLWADYDQCNMDKLGVLLSVFMAVFWPIVLPIFAIRVLFEQRF